MGRLRLKRPGRLARARGGIWSGGGLVAVGAGLAWGAGIGLIAAGALLIAYCLLIADVADVAAPGADDGRP